MVGVCGDLTLTTSMMADQTTRWFRLGSVLYCAQFAFCNEISGQRLSQADVESLLCIPQANVQPRALMLESFSGGWKSEF